MARKTMTSQDRKDQAEKLQASISGQIETLMSTEGWAQYLNMLANFHDYSFNNCMLILSQMSEASRVAGYKQWQKMGHQVRKGEKALKIFGYSTRIKKDSKGEPILDEKGEPKKVVYFPILSVFDVSQTDLMPGYVEPVNPVARLTGEDTSGLYMPVLEWITSQGWTVTREAIAGEMNGYTKMDGTRSIVVDSNLSDAQATKTLIHEVAHALLHEEITDYQAHRGVYETEAESVAYVVAGAFGMDTSNYTIGYVATWLDGDTDKVAITATNVLKTAHRIIDAVNDSVDIELAA